MPELFTAEFSKSHSKTQVVNEFMRIALLVLYGKPEIIKQCNYMTRKHNMSKQIGYKIAQGRLF